MVLKLIVVVIVIIRLGNCFSHLLHIKITNVISGGQASHLYANPIIVT